MEKMREEWKQRRRENRSKKRVAAAKEKQLDYKNAFGINDPTPATAIINIISEQKTNEKVKKNDEKG